MKNSDLDSMTAIMEAEKALSELRAILVDELRGMSGLSTRTLAFIRVEEVASDVLRLAKRLK